MWCSGSEVRVSIFDFLSGPEHLLEFAERDGPVRREGPLELNQGRSARVGWKHHSR